MGSTCDEVVGALLDDILGEICDPAGNGQTCADFLESFQSPNCVGEACEILEDPLGPWSLCDVNNTGAECPDPDDAIDHAWSIDNPLSSLNCTASVTGPDITEGGGMVRGRGTFDCGESTDSIYLTVCLHRRSGGVWVKMGCRKDFDVLFGSNSLSKKIVERCLKQQTVEYRIRARGQASDGPDEDRDAATQSAKLYCPGPSSVADASIDALEYAESWLPSHE